MSTGHRVHELRSCCSSDNRRISIDRQTARWTLWRIFRDCLHPTRRRFYLFTLQKGTTAHRYQARSAECRKVTYFYESSGAFRLSRLQDSLSQRRAITRFGCWRRSSDRTQRSHTDFYQVPSILTSEVSKINGRSLQLSRDG